VVQVTPGGNVGPADRRQVFHQGGSLLVAEHGVELLV
jgi:hypothetical protein